MQSLERGLSPWTTNTEWACPAPPLWPPVPPTPLASRSSLYPAYLTGPIPTLSYTQAAQRPGEVGGESPGTLPPLAA